MAKEPQPPTPPGAARLLRLFLLLASLSFAGCVGAVPSDAEPAAPSVQPPADEAWLRSAAGPEGPLAVYWWFPPRDRIGETVSGAPRLFVEVQPLVDPSGPALTDWVAYVFHIKQGVAWPTLVLGQVSVVEQPDDGEPMPRPLEPWPFHSLWVSNRTADEGFWVVVGAHADGPAEFGLRLRALGDEPSEWELEGPPFPFPGADAPWATPHGAGSGFEVAAYEDQRARGAGSAWWTPRAAVDREILQAPGTTQRVRLSALLASGDTSGWSLATGFMFLTYQAGEADVEVRLRGATLEASGPVVSDPAGAADPAAGFPNFKAIGDGEGPSRVIVRAEYARGDVEQTALSLFSTAQPLGALLGFPSLRDQALSARLVDDPGGAGAPWPEAPHAAGGVLWASTV